MKPCYIAWSVSEVETSQDTVALDLDPVSGGGGNKEEQVRR